LGKESSSANSRELPSSFIILPELGSTYRTENGTGVVEKINVFSKEMTVRHDDGSEERIDLSEKQEQQVMHQTTCRRIINNRGEKSESA